MAKKTINRTISFGKALEWLETKKDESVNADGGRLLKDYKRAHAQLEEYKSDITDIDLEIEKNSNSANTIKDGIIAMRGNKAVCDGMVIELNRKADTINNLYSRRNDLVELFNKSKRMIENYDRDNETELFFFWELLHDMLPDLTTPWFDFKHEHREFFYSNHL